MQRLDFYDYSELATPARYYSKFASIIDLDKMLTRIGQVTAGHQVSIVDETTRLRSFLDCYRDVSLPFVSQTNSVRSFVEAKRI